MTTNQAVVLSAVKIRLRINHNDLDPLILSYIDEIGVRISHYCNMDVIPDTLTFTWTSMVIDALRAEQSAIDEIAQSNAGSADIKIGDTSIKPVAASGQNKSAIDAVVLNYRVDLNRYRKLRW
ncbi:phage head-tail connector protein [Heliophilum fasciatum]|uniref:Gp6-like head-tail connector protein n=1 Tax=Heliophilum fasciatum TaxID=35700 RepID=A0A4R2RQS7_9FIRM|nr:phage head-tail connector protein [Heliophilum fasciatum]MCW2277738.1 hypothetical protein [Heliophilum fasciatum]TCP64767.1 gp6-like head-tail connector protein [Heliophilum fasciatum]